MPARQRAKARRSARRRAETRYIPNLEAGSAADEVAALSGTGRAASRSPPHIATLGDPAAPELTNLENNIREFDRIDHGGDGFRYPLNVSGTQPSLQNPPPNVNLRVLHEAMDAVATFLSCVRSEISARLDYVAEMEAEQRRNYRP